MKYFVSYEDDIIGYENLTSALNEINVCLERGDYRFYDIRLFEGNELELSQKIEVNVDGTHNL